MSEDFLTMWNFVVRDPRAKGTAGNCYLLAKSCLLFTYCSLEDLSFYRNLVVGVSTRDNMEVGERRRGITWLSGLLIVDLSLSLM